MKVSQVRRCYIVPTWLYPVGNTEQWGMMTWILHAGETVADFITTQHTNIYLKIIACYGYETKGYNYQHILVSLQTVLLANQYLLITKLHMGFSYNTGLELDKAAPHSVICPQVSNPPSESHAYFIISILTTARAVSAVTISVNIGLA